MKKLLIKCNVNSCDENGNSVLMRASACGMLEFCKVLLNKGALVELKDQEGETALYKAAS